VSGHGKTWLFLCLALRLWQSILRHAVRGNSLSGRIVRRQRVPVFERHRLPSTGSRWDIRWGSSREIAWFLSSEPGVMEESFKS
jgi:hypothetical protein